MDKLYIIGGSGLLFYVIAASIIIYVKSKKNKPVILDNIEYKNKQTNLFLGLKKYLYKIGYRAIPLGIAGLLFGWLISSYLI